MPQATPTLYTAATCPPCKQVKRFLAAHGIAWTERDIDADPASHAEVFQLTGQKRVPVLRLDGQFVIGYDEGAIRALLGL